MEKKIRYELKSIRIWSFTKVSFFVNLVFGFVLGLFWAMFLPFFTAAMSGAGGRYGRYGDLSEFPFGALVIIMPIMGAMFAAVFHTLIGIVVIATYNLVARVVGGLEMLLNREEEPLTQEETGPITAQTSATSGTPGPSQALASESPPPPPAVPGTEAAKPEPTIPDNTTAQVPVTGAPPLPPVRGDVAALPVRPAEPTVQATWPSRPPSEAEVKESETPTPMPEEPNSEDRPPKPEVPEIEAQTGESPAPEAAPTDKKATAPADQEDKPTQPSESESSAPEPPTKSDDSNEDDTTPPEGERDRGTV